MVIGPGCAWLVVAEDVSARAAIERGLDADCDVLRCDRRGPGRFWRSGLPATAGPGRHGDPADRFLGATTFVHGLILVTADKHLWETKSSGVLRNR